MLMWSGDEPGAQETSPLIDKPWFIATLIVLGVVLWSVLCLLSVCIYRRHKAGKKVPKNRARPGQSSLHDVTRNNGQSVNQSKKFTVDSTARLKHVLEDYTNLLHSLCSCDIMFSFWIK